MAALSPRNRLDLEPVFAYLIEKRGKSDVSRLTQADIYDVVEANRHRSFCEHIPTALHALRYCGVMELAWAGCDDDEIASYSGHASKSVIRKYAGEAPQIMRARQAHAKRR